MDGLLCNSILFPERVPRREAAILCEMHTDVSVNKETVIYTRKCPRRSYFKVTGEMFNKKCPRLRRKYRHGSLHSRNMPNKYN